MPPPPQEALIRYAAVRDELREHHSNAWGDVVRLCKTLPKKIDLQAFWSHGKDKPCWSNIRECVGQRIADDLTYTQDFNSYSIIASDTWNITMLTVGPQWKANTNFVIPGEAARHYLENIPPGGLASYKWRLYAIREFALSLTQEDRGLPIVSALIERMNCQNGLNADEIYPWSKCFAKVAGRGWGPTTVNHMLTDLGLSVKPDLHLCRSMVRLGLLGPEIACDLPNNEIKLRAAELGSMAVSTLVHLSQHLQPLATPYNPCSVLREMDKVLMEYSKLKLSHSDHCGNRRCRADRQQKPYK